MAFKYLGLSKSIVPAWNGATIAGLIGTLQFTEDRQNGYLSIVGRLPLTITLATGNGLLLGSTTPGAAQNWKSGADTGDSFAGSDEFRRLTAGRSAPVGTLLYVDLRSLVPLAAPPLNQLLPRLYEALQVDAIESLGLVTGEPSNSGSVRFAVGVREIKRGVLHLLASPPSEAALARAFPSSTTVFIHGSMEHVSDVIDDIRAFFSVIDAEITEEYDQERVDFMDEVGFDPQGEFLANFVTSWAFGATLDTDRIEDPMFVFQLASVDRFRAHMHLLTSAYGLQNSRRGYRGISIERAVRDPQPFSYAVVNDLLLVSADQEAVVQGIDALLDQKGLDRTESFRAVRYRLNPQMSKFVFLDITGMFSPGLESGEDADVPEEVLAIIRAGTAIGLAVVPHERMIAVEMATNDDKVQTVISLLWKSVSASLQQARLQSARVVTVANVKGLLVGCHIYAEDHGKQWPPSLEALVQSGVLGEPAEATRMLADPYGDGGERAQYYYLYRRISDATSVKEPAKEVVICEPEVRNGGAVFGFLDGHAEWIASPRAEELLANMR